MSKQRMNFKATSAFLVFLNLSGVSVTFASEEKSWDLKTAPIAFFAKWLTLDLSYQLNENWTLGPSLINYACSRNPHWICYNGNAVGINSNYYFTPEKTRTVYLSSHAYYEVFENRTSYSRDNIRKEHGYKANLAIGFRENARWGIFFLYGAGLEYIHRQVDEYDYDDLTAIETREQYQNSRGLPFLEFKVGVAF